MTISECTSTETWPLSIDAYSHFKNEHSIMEQKLQKLSQKCNVTVLRNAIEISPSMAMSPSDQEEDHEDQKYIKLQEISQKCNVTVMRNSIELPLSEQEDYRYQKYQKKYQKCASCGKEFTHSSYLKNHMQTVHQSRKEYKCEICEKVSNSNSNLKNHIKVVHEGRKDYKCSLCDLEFTSAEFLKNHAKKIHGAKLKKQVKYVAVQNE